MTSSWRPAFAEKGEKDVRENFSIEKVAKRLVETVTSSEIPCKSEVLNEEYKVTIHHTIFQETKRKILMLKYMLGSILTDLPKSNKNSL